MNKSVMFSVELFSKHFGLAGHLWNYKQFRTGARFTYAMY